MGLLAKVLNLGHDYDDLDFETWEMTTKYPLKRFKKILAKNIKELAGEGDTILSLGCGCSPILNMFHCSKIGVDIAAEKIEWFRSRTDAKLIATDITKLEPLGQFDIVLLNEVIEHVGYANVNKVLELVAKSLKPTGRAVISMPDMSSPIGYLVETILHKEIHTSLMFGRDLEERCRDVGLVLRDKRNWLWDTVYLFTRMEAKDVLRP